MYTQCLGGATRFQSKLTSEIEASGMSIELREIKGVLKDIKIKSTGLFDQSLRMNVTAHLQTFFWGKIRSFVDVH